MKALFFVLLFSQFAYAQPNPEEVKKEAAALIAEASSNIQYKCKCPVSFEVDWSSFSSSIAMKKVNYIIGNFGKGMPSFCADDGIKKACEIKRVNISFGSTPSATLQGGTAEIVTNGIVYDGFDKIMEDKEKIETEKSKPAPNP